MADLEGTMKERGDREDEKMCKGHCHEKCWMPTTFFDEKCTLQDSDFKKQTSQKIIKQVGTAKLPKWDLYNNAGQAGQRQKVLGSVSCPCNDAKGKDLSQKDAIKRIVGQVQFHFPDDATCNIHMNH